MHINYNKISALAAQNLLIVVVVVVGAISALSAAVYRYSMDRASFHELQELCVVDSDLRFEVAPRTTIKVLEEKLARDPEGAILLADLSRAYLTQGTDTKDTTLIALAESRANESLKIAPSANLVALETLARVASYSHEFAQAIALSERLIHEGGLQGHEIKISALLALGRIEDSQREAAQFVAIAPGLSSYLQMALVYETLGKIAEAERLYRAALAADPGTSRNASLWSRSLLARFFIRTKKFKYANALLSCINEFDPNYAFGVALRGELYLAQGRLDESSVQFERAFDLSRDPFYLAQAAKVLVTPAQ